MKKTRHTANADRGRQLLVVLTGFYLSALPGLADGNRCCIDWSKLNLTHTQSMQVKQLEDQWNGQYNELKPAIVDDERKLQEMVSDRTSDSFEVLALQASISRRKEQLSSAAMQNYLKKRQLLNEAQQRQLEQMVRNKIAEHSRQRNPGAQTSVMPDHVQELIQRVRSIWTDQTPVSDHN